MRFVLSLLLATVMLSGCALGVGGGVSGRLGSLPSVAEPECDDFESCDLMYRDALADAERCRHQGDPDDCESEDRVVAATYEVLHEQTERELDALHGEAQEREAALMDADQAAQAARLEEQDNCSRKGHPPEPPPAPRHGNGWFDSDTGAH